MTKNKNDKKKRKDSSTNVLTDDRFDTTNKPQFRLSSVRGNKQEKVVLDKRFQGVLTDERFQLHIPDKYGRKKNKSKARGNEKEQLAAFYTVEQEDKEEKEDLPQTKEEASEDEGDDENSKTKDSSSDDDEEPQSRIAYLTALSRGLVDVESSSDEGNDHNDTDDASTTADDNDSDDDASIEAGILDPSFHHKEEDDADLTTSPTTVLALQNLDWQQVRAVDVFALVSSFASAAGVVQGVRVYQSDFGQERLKHEEQHGPPAELWKKDNDSGKDKDNNKSPANAAWLDEEVEEMGKRSLLAGEINGDEDDQKEIQFSSFNPEALRAYEASKLRYYFALVEITHPKYAGLLYDALNDLEFEHSSASVQVRMVDMSQVESIVSNRPLRDQCNRLPSNYEPPPVLAVQALQQSNVSCTWEAGDDERERHIAQYYNAQKDRKKGKKKSKGNKWTEEEEAAEALQRYLASSESEGSDEEEDAPTNGRKKDAKASNMRKLLGLIDSDDDEDEDESDGGQEDDGEDVLVEEDTEDELSQDDMERALKLGLDMRDGDDEDANSDEKSKEPGSRQISYVPGRSAQLSETIRAKLNDNHNTNQHKEQDLTPWEKYKEKRKMKRRERRQAKKQEKLDYRKGTGSEDQDAFFLSNEDKHGTNKNTKLSKADLELLVAGDDTDELNRDYDMRELVHADKMASKKLKGARKRKEVDRADRNKTDVAQFQVDVHDERFQAVLDGSDARFGIDRTDPQYKETPAMRAILTEQTKRRKKRRKASNDEPTTSKKTKAAAVRDVVADTKQKNATKGGAAVLSALVKTFTS